MDIFSRFLDEGIIVRRLGGRVSKTELYAAYCQWVSDEGGEPLTKTTFGERMKQREYEDGRSMSERYWKDVKIYAGDIPCL